MAMKIDMLPPPTVSNPAAPVEYRVLTSEEIQTVKPVFDANGAPLPDPAISTFVGALKNGKVIGFLVLQLKLHAEPMWIEPGHSDVFSTLVKRAEEVILEKAGPQYVYLFTPAGKVTQLAQTMGCQVEPYVVMSKLVAPEMPVKPVVNLDLPPDTQQGLWDESEISLDEPSSDVEGLIQ